MKKIFLFLIVNIVVTCSWADGSNTLSWGSVSGQLSNTTQEYAQPQDITHANHNIGGSTNQAELSASVHSSINNKAANILASKPHVIDNTSPQDEHVLWRKEPINFVIPTGEERLLSFPGKVELINTNPDLTSDKVSIMNNAGTLYIKAYKPFVPIRVEVKIVATGETILVDISSKYHSDPTPLDVVLASSTDNNEDSVTHSSEQSSTSINDITLLRFAIQSLYAPARLVTGSTQINRTPMYTHKSVTLFYGGATNAYPIISWRGGDRYITAVVVKNVLSRQVVLDPRDILGNWQAISFYPRNILAKQGTKSDKTTAFLVSNKPFGMALQDLKQARSL